MTHSANSSPRAGGGTAPLGAPQLQAPLDTAALAQLATSIFRALPGQAPALDASASPASRALPASLADSPAQPSLPSPASPSASALRPPLSLPSAVPFGVQPPANLAPPASPLSSPAGLAPNLPGSPFPQGQVPGSNLLPASPTHVLNLGNRAPALPPHALAGNGVPDKAFSALPGYEPRLATLTQSVPAGNAAPAQAAPTAQASAANPSSGASPFYFVSETTSASAPAAARPTATTTTAAPASGGRENVDQLAQQALSALSAQSHSPNVPHLGLEQSRTQPANSTQTAAATPAYYFVDVPAASAGKNPQRPPFDVQAIRRDFPILSERIGGKPLVWLDNAATTQKPRQVIDRISHFYQHENSNIHRAAHELAARSTDAYEHAREVARRFINAPEVEEVIFVRGTTEAINLIAKSWGGQNVQAGDEIIISHLEHHANIVPWQQLAQAKGAKLRVIPVDDQGQVRLDEYQKLINDRTKIVSVAHVSNTLGTVVPIKEIVAIAKRHGIVTVIDGAQSIAHTPVDVQAIGADFFVFSGHKIFGPTGIGVLWGKRSVLEGMQPWQGGGNMIADVTFEKTVFQPLPNTFEAGTGNIADAVGLGAALEYVERIGIENISQYEHALVDYGMAALGSIKGLRLIGTVPGKASVLSFVLDGYSTDEVGQILNAEGIAVRTGHHCAQPILRRFGVETAIRPSLAFYNTFDEIDQLVRIIERLAGQRRHH